LPYVAIRVNFSGLSAQEETELRNAAADLGLDALKLFPEAPLGGTELTLHDETIPSRTTFTWSPADGSWLTM
jgi:hypothetical protein